MSDVVLRSCLAYMMLSYTTAQMRIEAKGIQMSESWLLGRSRNYSCKCTFDGDLASQFDLFNALPMRVHGIELLQHQLF